MTSHTQPLEHVCQMPDGALLRGDLWETVRPTGIVILRTPYGARRHTALARSWVQRGFHCLVQDVRGRHRSTGAWSPYQHEGSDGAETVAALRRAHPGLPLVVFGASYAAHTALEAARSVVLRGEAAPAAVMALVPALGLAETAWNSAGEAQMRHRIGWWHEHGQGRFSHPPLPPDDLARRTVQAEAMGPVAAARSWGWAEHTLVQWERLWQAPRLDLASRYGSVASPLLVITGEEDFFDVDAHALAASWPGVRHLVTGPWGHGLAGGITDPRLRERLRAAGGIGSIIDAWLAATGLMSRSPGSVVLPLGTTTTTSRFDAADGTWHHERSTA